MTEEEATGLSVDAVAIRLLHHVQEKGETQLRNVVAELQSQADVIKQRKASPPGVVGGTVVGTSSSGALSQHYELAMSEAWYWLLSNGLIAEIPLKDGWFVVSRLGRKLLEEDDPAANVRAERRIALDLHPSIQAEVRAQFLLGQYEAAVLIAMRAVEERVREMAGASGSDIGVSLMQQSFGDGGPLRDAGMDPGEAQSQMALFWGAIGFFKNPASHRKVHYEDATEASETVLLADLLLRILDRLEAQQGSG